MGRRANSNCPYIEEKMFSFSSQEMQVKQEWDSIYHMLDSSVQFNRSVMSNSLQLHGLQQARPPCPSPTPRVYSNSCPLS